MSMRRFVCVVTVVAVLFLPLAAMAGTTLYGNARISVNYIDDDPNEGLSAQDNVSRLGVQGSYGDTIKGFFHLQVAARVAPDGSGDATFVTDVTETTDPDTGASTLETSTGSSNDSDAFGQRFYFAGLSGAFGRLAYGRVTNTYKMPGFQMNGKLYDTATIGVGGSMGMGGATYGLSAANNGFTPTVVQYDTPSISGLKLSGTIAIDGSSDDEHGYIGAVSYSGFGVTAGAVYATNSNGSQLPNIEAEGEAIRAYCGYKAEAFSVGVSYENIDISGDGTDDKVNYVFGIGSVNVAPKLQLIAAVGVVDSGPAEGVGSTVGLNYGITENTEVLISGSYGDMESGTNPVGGSVLFVHNFSISSN